MFFTQYSLKITYLTKTIIYGIITFVLGYLSKHHAASSVSARSLTVDFIITTQDKLKKENELI